MRLGRKGRPSLCSKPQAQSSWPRGPSHPALAQQRQGSPRGWWHRGAGERISNLGVESKAALMVCSTGLKTRMINESNAMEEPESK